MGQSLTVLAESGGSASWQAIVLWSGATAILVVVLMNVLQRRLQRTQPESGRNRGPAAGGGGSADAARAAGLMNDMDELSQRLAADLDRRAGRVEELIAHADERIRRLEDLAASTAGRMRPVDGASSVVESKRNGGGGGGARPQPHPLDPIIDPDPITTQIYRLADDGLAPIEIAKRLSQHTGKVELILALRQR